ncbi:ArsC/Spx/MgsR family protein [Maricaulis sp. CAU 1757]
MSVFVYGLKNCDTCRRAMRDLASADVTYTFVDIREEADRATKVPVWVEAVGGDVLVNTRSATWRNLSAEDRSFADDDPAGLLIVHPTLIKRPVIETPGGLEIGWNSEIRDRIVSL